MNKGIVYLIIHLFYFQSFINVQDSQEYPSHLDELGHTKIAEAFPHDLWNVKKNAVNEIFRVPDLRIRENLKEYPQKRLNLIEIVPFTRCMQP